MPLPPAARRRSPSPPIAVLDPVAGEHPERAAGDHQDHGRDRAQPALDREPKITIPTADDEQVADVGVDEGGGEVAPPLALDRTDDRRRASVIGRSPAALDEDQQRRREDRGDHRVAALPLTDQEARPRPALAALGPLAAAALRGGTRGGSSSSPWRSSFGARLRSRVPQ